MAPRKLRAKPPLRRATIRGRVLDRFASSGTIPRIVLGWAAMGALWS